jgi:hypothetical protein
LISETATTAARLDLRTSLQVRAAEVDDLANGTLVDELLGVRDGRRAAVVERHGVHHSGPGDGLEHGPSFGGAARQGFLADDVLARLRRGDGDVRVQVIGCGDIDDIDRVVLKDAAPIAGPAFVAEALGGFTREVLRNVGHNLAHRDRRRRPEEHGHRGIRK